MKPLWRLPARQIGRKLLQFIVGFVYILVRPLIPYEATPGQPNGSFVAVTGKCTKEQLALCQGIFDEGMARRRHVEQKAQWTFTAIAFLLPTLASILFFFLQDARARLVDQSLLLSVIGGSTTLLILSFVSALRAMAVKHNESLFVHAVIEDDGTKFRSYEIEFHAKGLLLCATRNTTVNDHIAQFVKGAHTLLVVAVIGFALGMSIIGFDMGKARGSQGDVTNTNSSSSTQQEKKILNPEWAKDGPKKADRLKDGFPW